MAATTTITATPTKLRSGEWGARVKGTARQGQRVTIKTKSGKSWDAEVTKVVWSGDGVSLCATRSLDRPHTSSRSTSNRQFRCGHCGGLRYSDYCPGFDCDGDI